MGFEHGRAPSPKRWALAGALLLIEYLAISLGFDAQWVLDERGGDWKRFGDVGVVGHVAMLAATVLLALSPKARSEGASWLRPVPGLEKLLLGLHVLAFVAFVGLSKLLFGDFAGPSGSALAWLGGWAALGLTSAASLGGGLLGVPRLRPGSALLLFAASLAVALLARELGEWSQALWHPAALVTLIAVAAVLRPAFPELAVDHANRYVTLGEFSVEIAPQCSGLEGVGLASVVLGTYLAVFRKTLRFPNAWLLLPLGMIAVWVGNVGRLSSLILLGAFVDPELAVGGFHSKAGWVLFCAITLGVTTLGHRSGIFSKQVEQTAETENPTAAFLMPLLILIGTAMVTGAFARTYDTLYGLRVLLAGAALVYFRRYYRDLELRFSPLAIVVGLVVAAGWLGTAPAVEPTEAMLAMAGAGAGWLFVRAAGSALMVPICEELAFRGFLLRWLISRDFTSVAFTAWTPLSAIVSSLVFGFLHERWLAATLAGVAYAALQIRSGRLFDAIVAHGVTNGAIAAWSIATGDYSHW